MKKFLIQCTLVVVFIILNLTTLITATALTFDKDKASLEELTDYEVCQTRDRSGQYCQQALSEWVEKHPQDAFKAGKMTRKKMNSWMAIPFFTRAFQAKAGSCDDEDVKLAVVAALNLPPREADLIAQAKKIGFDLCFEEIKSSIVQAASTDSYLFKNVCTDLVAHGALTGLKKKKCTSAK